MSLDSAADQIKDYFANDAERLDVIVNTSRGQVSLFVEREILHMIDVKELMRLVASVSIWFRCRFGRLRDSGILGPGEDDYSLRCRNGFVGALWSGVLPWESSLWRRSSTSLGSLHSSIC